MQIKRSTPHKTNRAARDEMVTRYLAGEPCGAIAESFGLNEKTVWYHLKQRGVPRRSTSEAKRTLSLNHAAFSTLTRDAAYWTGFLFADGCIRHEPGHSPALICLLSTNDLEHLGKLRDFLGAGHKLHVRKGTNPHGEREVWNAVLTVRSKRLVADLEAYGLNAASLERRVCAALAYSPDFWRGVIDGDGAIPIPTSGGKARITLVGGRALLEQFRDFATSIGIPSRPSVLKRKGRAELFGSITYMTHSARKLIACLYEDAPTRLERKHASAMRALATGQRRPSPWLPRG